MSSQKAPPQSTAQPSHTLSHQKDTKPTQRNQHGDHIGYLSVDALLTDFKPFKNQYDQYQVSASEIEKIRAIRSDIEVLILMATWCHDSKREVSRWLKIMHQSKSDYINTKLYAIDRDKTDPINLAEKYNLIKTPTFIVKYQSEEIARIIEKPTKTLVEDFVEISHLVR